MYSQFIITGLNFEMFHTMEHRTVGLLFMQGIYQLRILAGDARGVCNHWTPKFNHKINFWPIASVLVLLFLKHYLEVVKQ